MDRDATVTGREPDRSEALERAILALAAERAPKTFCPSEAARRLSSDEATWRAVWADPRRAAARLARAGRLQVTQEGAIVDAEAAKGPIRLSAPATPSDAGRGSGAAP